MRSLIYKDFANLKVQGKTYLLIIAVWTVVAWTEKNPSFLGGVLAVFSVLIAITTYAYDERSGWDSYALTMPIGKRELILSKYVVSVLTLGCGMLIFTALNLFLRIEPAEFVPMLGIFLAIGLVAADIILPFIFRFGTEKGRILLFLVFLVPAMLVTFLEKSSLNLQITISETELCTLAICAGVVLLPISVCLSFHLYNVRSYRAKG